MGIIKDKALNIINKIKEKEEQTRSKRELLRSVKDMLNLYSIQVVKYNFDKIDNELICDITLRDTVKEDPIKLTYRIFLEENNELYYVITVRNNKTIRNFNSFSGLVTEETLIEREVRVNTPIVKVIEKIANEFPLYYFKEYKNNRIRFILNKKVINLNDLAKLLLKREEERTNISIIDKIVENINTKKVG